MQRKNTSGKIIIVLIVIAIIGYGAVSFFIQNVIRNVAIDTMGTKNTTETNDWGGQKYYSFGLNAKLPENFPEDIYVLEGSTLNLCQMDTNKNNEVVQLYVTGRAGDELEEAFKKYKAKYQGYNEYKEYNNGSKNRAVSSYTIEFKKGEIEYRVSLTRDSNDTEVNFTIQMKDMEKI